MSSRREKLIRECFELERDIHYQEFRHHHWSHPEIVATCPDPGEREEVLRGFWKKDAENKYPEYRAAAAGLSLEELEMEKEQWLDRLSCVSTTQYQEILAEAARRSPANDNEKARKR